MATMSFNDLNGKVCVITGGAGVIGSALVRAMASVGVKIAIADINKETAETVATAIASEFNAQVIGVEANVLDKESLIRAKQIINEQLGDIDLLINGAGGNHPTATTKVEQMDESSLDHLEDTFYG
ncbi:MAG: SDR family NAD(P)-dependent oxidoreductase, partial [Methylococcaceae bacterium]